MKQNIPEDSDGTPLAVCVNDCEIDYGQPQSELASVCFRLCCAFAEMRWGAPASDTPIPLPRPTCRVKPQGRFDHEQNLL